MTLPKIVVTATANVDPAVAGLDRVADGYDDVGAAANRARSKTDKFGQSQVRAGRGSSAFGRGIQNASYQVGDFAVQVGAGTAASMALGQQLPQLLGGFGILGALLGAVAAISVPLVKVFKDMNEQGADLGRVLGTLEPIVVKIGEAFRLLGSVMVYVAEIIINNLDRIVIVGATVAAFWAGPWVYSMVAARVATLLTAASTWTLLGALTALKSFMARFLPTAIFIAIGELAFQFTRLVKAAGGFGNALGLLRDAALDIFARMGNIVNKFVLNSQAYFMDLRASALDSLANIIEGAGDWANKFVNIFLGAKDAIVVIFKSIPDIIGNAILSTANKVVSGIEGMINKLIEGVDKMIASIPSKIREVMGITDGIGPITLDPIDNPFEGAGADTIAGAKDAFNARQGQDTLGVAKRATGLRTAAGTATLAAEATRGIAGGIDTDSPLESVQKIKDLLASIKEDKITLPDLLGFGGDEEDDKKGGKKKDPLDEKLKGVEKRIKDHFDRIKALTEGGLSDKLGAWGSYFSNLATLMGTSNKKLLGIAKAFQASQSLIDAWGAYTKVLNDPSLVGRPFARVAAAAQVFAAGLGAVNAIKSIGEGGGGATAGAAAGAAGGGAGAAPQQQNSQSVALTIQGEIFNRQQVVSLINSINEAQEDGAIIRVVSQ
jgi:hypothetical protein